MPRLSMLGPLEDSQPQEIFRSCHQNGVRHSRRVLQAALFPDLSDIHQKSG